MAQPALNYRGVESIAQVEGEHDCLTGTPWAKLGHKIPKGASVREMLQAAGLDWRVLRGESYIRVQTEDGEVHRVGNPKAFALVRDSDFQVLSPYVGPRYKLIQNQDAFEVFAEFVEAGQMTMETAGSLSNGQHIWGLARTGHGFELANGERIESYFLLLQSHLYGYALKAMWTPIRFPGGHTLVQNITKAGVGGRTTYSMSHARKFDEKRIAEIKEVVGIAAKSMEDFRGKAEFMARSEVNTADAILYLTQVFDKDLPGRLKVAGERMPTSITELLACSQANRNIKKVAAALDRNRANDKSAWGCWNTVNHAYDHTMGHGDNTRLESIWLGKNRDAKVGAFNLAEALAAKSG